MYCDTGKKNTVVCSGGTKKTKMQKGFKQIPTCILGDMVNPTNTVCLITSKPKPQEIS